jgi:hypothetical protein
MLVACFECLSLSEGFLTHLSDEQLMFPFEITLLLLGWGFICCFWPRGGEEAVGVVDFWFEDFVVLFVEGVGGKGEGGSANEAILVGLDLGHLFIIGRSDARVCIGYAVGNDTYMEKRMEVASSVIHETNLHRAMGTQMDVLQV